MRSVRFGMVLSVNEREALTRLTEAEGDLSQAAVLRRLIRHEAKRRGLLDPRVMETGESCKAAAESGR